MEGAREAQVKLKRGRGMMLARNGALCHVASCHVLLFIDWRYCRAHGMSGHGCELDRDIFACDLDRDTTQTFLEAHA